MAIRKATKNDAAAIRDLLEQLDYPVANGFVEDKLAAIINHPDQVLLVYTLENKVVAFISIHFVPQIAMPGDFAVISYFSVDNDARGKGIGKELEDYCTKLALDRKCDRIQVHCHSRRIEAHKFYERQGYEESPKYYVKKLQYK
ncbi:MAG: GNAT family N-acetyltransferase [Mucilaginibacter sp.]